MPRCFECKSHFPSLKGLSYHLQIEHRVLSFKCGVIGCWTKFYSLKQFRSHYRKVHPTLESEGTIPAPYQSNPSPEGLVNDYFMDIEEVDNNEQTDNVKLPDVTPQKFKEALESSAEKFVAKLYSKGNLPRSYVQTIINDTDVFLGGGFMNILKEKCLSALNSSNADVKEVNDIQNMFEVLEDPFKSLKSEYMRIKYFTASGHYIPPVDYQLGKDFVLKSTKTGRKILWSSIVAQHVPLRYTLKKFLELPNCLEDILNYIESLKLEEDTISNFVQGELWQSKLSKYGEDDIVLPINAFFDDLECNNALGPHPGKLGAVYASIPCLPPECRSALKNIFLSLLFNSADRVEFGNVKVLEPLINELTFLEENGIIVQTPSGEKKVFFMLGLVIGDNLGIHQIFNLVECFKANYPCRFCRVSKEQMAQMTKVNNSLLRNSENYEADCLLGDVSRTGVNAPCELNKIPSFHITTNYAVDYMHDLPEGVIKYVMGFIINDFISKKYFTLKVLNNRIRLFDFGTDSSNRPPELKEEALKKGKVKLSASEAICFTRHFGVLVGDLVPTSDLTFRLYLSLMRVLDVVLAKTVPRSTESNFSVLVEELLCLYLKLGNSMKPKFHFLLHYAVVFRQCGPVSHLSCMRYEGKHREIKQTTVTNMSRVNLSYSAGVKHQLKQVSRFIAGESIMPSLEVGSCQEVYISDHEHYCDFESTLPSFFKNETQSVLSYKWVNFKGTQYSKPMILITDRDPAIGWPTFGRIELTLIDDCGVPLFVCNSLRNLGFSDHFYGFEIVETNEWFCISPSDLVDPLPLSISKAVNGLKFVILRYGV